MTDSTKKGSRKKPAKPYDDFPLFAHVSGRWAKKINGSFAYFGKWEDGWEKAWKRSETEMAELFLGRKSERDPDLVTDLGVWS